MVALTQEQHNKSTAFYIVPGRPVTPRAAAVRLLEYALTNAEQSVASDAQIFERRMPGGIHLRVVRYSHEGIFTELRNVPGDFGARFYQHNGAENCIRMMSAHVPVDELVEALESWEFGDYAAMRDEMEAEWRDDQRAIAETMLPW